MAAPPLPPKSNTISWMRENNAVSVSHEGRAATFLSSQSPAVPQRITSDHFASSVPKISDASAVPPVPPRPGISSWSGTDVDVLSLVPPPPSGATFVNNSSSLKFPLQPRTMNGAFSSSTMMNMTSVSSSHHHTISTLPPRFTNIQPPVSQIFSQQYTPTAPANSGIFFTNAIYNTSFNPQMANVYGIHHSRSAPNLSACKPNDPSAVLRGSIPNGNLCNGEQVAKNNVQCQRFQNRNSQANLENVLNFMKKKRDGNLIDLYCNESETQNSKLIGSKKADIDDILKLFDPLVESTEEIVYDQPVKVTQHVASVASPSTVGKNEKLVVCLADSNSVRTAQDAGDVTEKSKDSTIYASINFESTALNNVLNVKKSGLKFKKELYIFVEKLKKLRSEYSYDDHPTNSGVVISPTLDCHQEDALSIQLMIHSVFSERPVSFTCDVNTSIEHIISHAVCTVFDDTSAMSMDDFILKVYGISEYFSVHSCLADYEYVHQCHKFDRPVCLTLIDTKDLDRPFARSKSDDLSVHDLKVNDIAPKRGSTIISYETLSILIETLQKETEKLKTNALKCSTSDSLCPQGVVQAVKAICTYLSHIETMEVTDAVSNLIHVSLLFGKNDISKFDILPELGILEDNENQEELKLDGLVQLLDLSLLQVHQAIEKILMMYAQAFSVDFEVSSAKIYEESKPVTDFLDTVLVYLGILHGLSPTLISQFENFTMKCELCYGEDLIGSVVSKTVFASKSFFPRLVFDEWLQFENISMCTLPREAVFYFTLLGDNSVLSEAKAADDMLSKTVLGWSSISLFSCTEELVQGSLLLGVWPPDLPRYAGSRASNLMSSDSLLQVVFPEFDCNVKFPAAIDSKYSPFNKRDFDGLDPNLQRTLMEIVQRDAVTPLKPEEKELLWDKKNYLYKYPLALPKVLLSAYGWDWACLSDIYSLLEAWQPLSPYDSLSLLLPCFPDKRIRETAIHWMKNLVSDELCDYLPQMIQVLRYEMWDDSCTAWFLLERSLTSVRVAHCMYWLLKQNIDDPVAGKRMKLMMNALLAAVGSGMRENLENQEALLFNLSDIAEKIKTTKESLRLSVLTHELEITHHNLSSTPTCLPLSPALEVCGVDVKSCSYFTSNTLPLKILFHSSEKGTKFIEAIYKVGDDLRQDMITLQMIRIMDKLWLKEGLDLKMVTFMCVATEHRKGIVELVPEAETLCRIQKELGLTGSFKDRSIAEWLQKYNTSELEYQQAVDNFTLSCAGYCVATYILGICDRHNDNIMIKTSGHIFHIDFGKYLGDAQMFGSFKRDRTPFVLTSDMAYVINGGEKPSKKFQYFIDLCCQAFNIIRKNSNIFFNLFMLMVQSGVPGLSRNAVQYIKNALLPELSEAEATGQFTRMIQESLKSWFTQFNFFIHNLAQLKFTGDHNDDLLLSFIPKTFTKESDGKITSASVIGCKKMYDPEKYYLYVIKIERQNLPVSSCIFRTYREFIEFHQKLCIMFPLAKFHSLPGNPLVGRKNIREVADRRKEELDVFLHSLLCMADEIAHCDLVYTFFHPLLRDQEGIEDAKEAKEALMRARRGSSIGEIYGQIKLSILYKNKSLFIMIMHAKNLSSSKGTAPDPYVKTYLLPDPNKLTKRKTKTIFKNCHPTFMEMLVYCLPLEVIKYRSLHVSVWDYDRVQENEFLGAVLIPLSDSDLCKEKIQWYQLGGFNP